MSPIRVMSVFGTRPEAIKMAPLCAELAACNTIQSVICVTAQHREMLDSVLSVFSLQANYDLNLMRPGQTLSSLSVDVLRGMDRVFDCDRPNLVLVHGDTTTSTMAALSAFYRQIPVGHVEAGLRTFDPLSPFPEEMNRQLTARMAALHFAPTQANAANLRAENVQGKIYVTGNTVIDALHQMVRADYTFRSAALRGLDFSRPTVLLTAHRRENFGLPLQQIFQAVLALCQQNPSLQVIYPVHPNPNVRTPAIKTLGNCQQVKLIDPVDVGDMHNLMGRCVFVMTDSGGLQEEAPALGKPVLVLRTETERPEAVQAGTAMLAGIETERIAALAQELLTQGELYQRMAQAINPYGDGHAAKRIVSAICEHFSGVQEEC